MPDRCSPAPVNRPMQEKPRYLFTSPVPGWNLPVAKKIIRTLHRLAHRADEFPLARVVAKPLTHFRDEFFLSDGSHFDLSFVFGLSRRGDGGASVLASRLHCRQPLCKFREPGFTAPLAFGGQQIHRLHQAE